MIFPLSDDIIKNKGFFETKMETGGTKGGVKRKSARVAEQEAEKKRKEESDAEQRLVIIGH